MNKHLGKIILGAGVLFGLATGMNCPTYITKPIETIKYVENDAEDVVERKVIIDAADRMLQLQNANGSWDWDVTNKTAPTATTYLNIAGVTGEVLLDAFKLTNNSKYLDAAKKTGDHIVAGVGALPAERHFNAFNMVFLNGLAEASGNTSYSDFVNTKMNDLFTKVTYWGAGAVNINTDGIPGLTADELVAAEEVIRGTSIWGIKPWDLYHFVELAKKVGNNTFANGVADGIENYLNQPSYNDASADSYELGLSGGIMGLKNAGKNYNTLLNKLVTKQKADGSFGACPVQDTAYSLMALDSVGRTLEAQKAADYLKDNFEYNGFNGWLESDGKEYSESTSEAAHGLYQNHKK